jgi:hypothetical protein
LDVAKQVAETLVFSAQNLCDPQLNQAP